MKRLLRIAIAGTLLFAAVASAASARRCTIAGSWYGESSDFVFLITFIPVDNSHRKFVVVADADASTPLPGTEEITSFQGSVQRVGPRSFVQSALAYARADGPVGWVATFAVNGAWELTEDCSTAEVAWEGAAYAPGSDPFDGAVGQCLPPVTGTYRRVPIAPLDCVGP